MLPDIWNAALLGVVQGLTEFLPISSSGHLVIVESLLGIGQPGLTFEVVVHVGTLLAVFVVFRSDFAAMLAEPFRAMRDREAWSGPTRLFTTYPALRMILLVLAATIPTGIIGLGFKDTFERAFSSLNAVAFALCVTGLLLVLSKRFGNGTRGVLQAGIGAALVIGIAQGAAVMPGLSRSGTTICVALFLGCDREFAGRFSFLAAVPAILGATLVTLSDVDPATMPSLSVLATGLIASAIVGYAALRWLLAFVRGGKLHYFAPYCWALAVVILAYGTWK